MYSLCLRSLSLSSLKKHMEFQKLVFLGLIKNIARVQIEANRELLIDEPDEGAP